MHSDKCAYLTSEQTPVLNADNVYVYYCSAYSDNTTDPCATVLCDVGYYCVSDSATGDVYCQPSCDIANGGCAEDEQCSLELVACITTPCPPQVVCTPTGENSFSFAHVLEF